MSSITQAAAFIMIGGIGGIGGFALLGQSAPAASPQHVAIAPIAAPTVEVEPEAVPEPEAVSVSYGTTGGVESDAPSAAFAVFNVTSTVDVADVALNIAGARGARVDEAVGYEWSKTGSSLTVDIGDMTADEERTVIVAFTLREDSARFKTHTAFRDLHTGKIQKVQGASQGHSISRKLYEPSIYETVRLGYSDQAMDMASTLMAEKDYKEALTWIDDAYARNVEVGMALRLTGELSATQTRLSSLQDELELLSKPKPKAKRVKPKGPVIDWVFGDRASPSSS